MPTRYPALKRSLRKAGLRVMRERSLPRSLDPCVDLREIDRSTPVRFVVDVGANVGQSVATFLEEFPGCRVLACEPSPAFRVLQQRHGRDPRVDCRNVAVGESRGTVDFEEVEPHSEVNRVLREPRRVDTKIVQVPVEPLDGILSSVGDPPVDLLKIDVEGYEIPVLRGGLETFRRGSVRAVLIECTFEADDTDHTPFSAITDLLGPLGFHFLGLYDVHHRAFRIGYANALFFRPPR